MGLFDQFGDFLNKASPVLTPFANKLAYGASTASELALVQERNRWNSLNGSGAADPMGAETDAARRNGWGGLTNNVGSPPTWVVIAGGALAVVLVLALIFRR